MNPSTNTSGGLTGLIKLSLFIGLALVVYSVYIMISAVSVVSSTGILKLSSSSPGAALTISQSNSQAVLIGFGTAQVRLKPGSYRISASVNGYQSVSLAQVRKSETTKIVLTLVNSTNTPPSSNLYGLNIQNTNTLSDLLLSEQFDAVLQETSSYVINHVNSNAQSVSVTKTTVNQDGSIDFAVSTNTNPNESFTVLLQKQPDGIITFSVPVTGFMITLNPYGS